MSKEAVLEVVVLNVSADKTVEFEANFKIASQLIARTNGYIKHELRPCVEKANQYILLVWWDSIDAHMVNFRNSEEFKEWQKLLNHYYEQQPEVLHYSASLI